MKIEDALQKYRDQECAVYLCDNQCHLQCTIVEIGDGWIRVIHEDKTESIINLNNLVRVREIPRNKNGKKKLIYD